MTRARFPILAGVLVSCLLAAAAGRAAAPPVTLTSLLDEMVDRNAEARWPAPAYTLRNVSSHDPSKNDPGNEKTWHSNSDAGQFMHTELHDGRREWVILDDRGPGAITRFWVPLDQNKDNQVVRFYLDGAATPAITAKLNELIGGQAFVHAPLAFVSWNLADLRDELKPGFKAQRGVGADLYLPIPFARSCKITLDSVPFYYGINYRIYEPGTMVKSFTMADFTAAKPTIERVSQALLAEPAERLSATAAGVTRGALAPGAEMTMNLVGGPEAVRTLQVQIDPKQANPALRSLVLQATFDDERTIWCPIGDFFGAGVRLNPVRDWMRSVSADGTLTSHWVMPYQRSGRLSLKNVGTTPLSVKWAVVTDPWRWDDRSLHFHADWHAQFGMKTRPYADWNYVEAQGKGQYVGDTLTVFTPESAWYGEGDERIYVDGETYPFDIGTGTEDYYGYAWGMASFFNSPFISVPRRDILSRDNWKGYTTTSRLRSLDAIPFRTGIKMDMEIWNWADTAVDYAAATFYYARPGAKTNRTPQPAEAAAPLRPAVIDPGPLNIAGAIEFETAKISAKSPDVPTEVQGGGLVRGQWSNEQQLFARAVKAGDFVELEIPADGPGPRKIIIYGTKAKDYGILRFTVNGKPAADGFDGYSPDAVASGPIDLGTFEPKGGKFLLRVEVVGTNPASVGARYYFGLDCAVLQKP